MPLVPYEAAVLSRRATLGGMAQPGDVAEDAPPLLDTLAASIRKNNSLGDDDVREAVLRGTAAGGPTMGLAEAFVQQVASSFDNVYDPHFDPLSDEQLAGYEPYADRFIGSGSAAESQRIKNRINTELANNEVIRQSGWAGVASSIAAGLVDPITIASMAVPVVGTGTRTVRIAKGIAASIALDSAQELVLHSEQELRTAGESVINVGAGALLTGALGHIATRIPKAEFTRIQKELKTWTDGVSPHAEGAESTAGAARTGFGTTLEDETVARGGEGLLKSLGQVSPIGRVLQSQSKRARILLQQLVEVVPLLNKHFKGIPSPMSVERVVAKEQAARHYLLQATDEAWRSHKLAGGAMTRDRFAEEISVALRRGDQSIDADVTKVARVYRQYFDQSLEQLKAARLVPEDTTTQFAQSYLPRVYDHLKIRATRNELEQTLGKWFSRSGQVDQAEVQTAVQDVIGAITGDVKGSARVSGDFVGKTGSLQARTLSVPDEVLEPWLVNNIDHIMDRYIRTVTPQLRITQAFGDLDMKQALQDVTDEYQALITRASTSEAKTALSDEMGRVQSDIIKLRDRLLGTHGAPADPNSFLVRTGRVVRSWNYIRTLGGQVFASFADVGRTVMRHGLQRTGSKLARLAGSPELRALSREQAHKAGVAFDYAMNTRSDTLGEIGDELQYSRVDRFLRRESNRFTRITFMASWNDALKTTAVALEQDAIIAAAKGGQMTAFQRATMASLGVGDRMLERIGEQLDVHAVKTDGLHRANTDAWTDKEASAAFEHALGKSAETVVMTKGAGDTPHFLATELGRTLLQFKGFGIASVNRLLIPAAQGVAHGDLATLNGLWMMMAMGAVSNAARDYAAGFKPATDPGRAAIEAFDRAGLTAYISEPFDVASGLVGGPRIGRFTAGDILETGAGPAFGSLVVAFNTARGIFTEGGVSDPHVKAADIYRLRKLLPYQNLFYLRRVINMLEGEFGEFVGADGATSQSFGDRLVETKDLQR